MGYNRTLIERGVALLLDCPWGTAPAEQLHASAASLMRIHPVYETETLINRSSTLQLNRLLPRPTNDEAAVSRLEARVARLDEKQPSQLRAVNMYVKDLAATAKVYK